MSEQQKLLRFLSSFTVVAVKKFVAKNEFREGNTTDGVSIAWLGGNFKNNFLGKTEEDVEATELKIHKLIMEARDLPKDDEPGIIPELAGKHEIKLAHFFQLLTHKQKTEDFAGIVAYICDENGTLVAVGARWSSGRVGWGVSADPIVDLDKWPSTLVFVSR